MLQRDAQTQQEPGRIEFYRMMYYNAGKGWSGSAQENYVRIMFSFLFHIWHYGLSSKILFLFDTCLLFKITG